MTQTVETVKGNHRGITFPSRFLLTGGTVIDGTAAPRRRADIVVSDGRVEELLAPDADCAGAHRVDISGLAVAPGFIDLHTHCDFTLPRFPRAESMLRQGVTTLLVGNCGHSVFPYGNGEHAELARQYSSFLAKDLEWHWHDVDGYVRHLESLPLAPNVALLVGLGTIRIAVLGFDRREPTDDELDTMRNEVAHAMAGGAFGVSSGLIYPPGSYASTEEILALAEVAARFGGIYATHIRNEGPQLVAAVREALDVGARAGIPVQLSHHKVLGRTNWGLTKDSLEVILEARRNGLDVTADQYPYNASSTTLTALIPQWAMSGGIEKLRDELRNTSTRDAIRSEILHGPVDGRPRRDFEPDTVVIASVPDPARSDLVGRSLAELAEQADRPAVEVMLDLLATEGPGLEVVIFAIGEDDIRRVMSEPFVAVASDGWTLSPDEGGTPHPRSYGTFARILGHYVRDEAVLTLEDAVHKMTQLPARRLGLSDRGMLTAGAHADLVIFDPTEVRERATYRNPHQYATGIRSVFVNGQPVILDGQDTGLAAGTVLRHGTGNETQRDDRKRKPA